MLCVRGENIEIEANVRVCSCGNELFDEHLEEENLKKAYDIYRKKYQLLLPREIRAIREKYGLPQRTLGRILGWGDITIHRYETGALPDSSHHKMLKLLDNPKVMKDLLIQSRDLMPKTTFIRAMEKIDMFLEEKGDNDFLHLLQERFMHTSVDIESGFMQFDLQKFNNVVLYFAQNVSQLYKTKLNKLLFYVDFKCFKEYTVSLTGSKYIRLEYGPVPNNYEGLLWSLENLGYIMVNPIDAGDYIGYLIQPLAEFDPDVFTGEEVSVLDEIKSKYGSYSSGEISQKSHEENGWLNTPFSEVISYKYAMELNE